MASSDYSFGIEEEYFLTQERDGGLAVRSPENALERLQASLGRCVTSELLQSQIEIATPILHDATQARDALHRLRSEVDRLVSDEGLRVLAASTHPLGAWREQKVTDKPRYDQILSDFRIVGLRNLVCGMHVHVHVPEGVDRVALMNRAMPWLPLFLALSTSSPFWDRRVTGLLSYRQSVFDEWPRSGIPDFFDSEADYGAFADLLRDAGALEDSSYLWWAIRPARKYPTLELRIADVCTHPADAVALASLFRCLIARLVRDPQLGARRSTHTRRIIDENRWHAKRDGIDAKLIDEASRQALSVRETAHKLLELVTEEAAAFGCEKEIARVETILEHGTSAHAQLRLFDERCAAGDTEEEALLRVVRWLIARTVSDRHD